MHASRTLSALEQLGALTDAAVLRQLATHAPAGIPYKFDPEQLRAVIYWQ